jgi:MFS family permease
MLITNSEAILTDATTKNELGLSLGINQIAFRLGSILGLTLSGVILSVADWRFLFYINVPIGLFGTLWAHIRLREIAKLEKTKRIDWPGFLTFTFGITALLLGIAFSTYGGRSFIEAVFLYGVGTILIVSFVFLELHDRSPILDLSLFKIKEYAFGNLALVLNAIAWGAMTLIISFYLQRVKGYSAFAAGVSLLPLEATYIIAGPISGKLSDKLGVRGFSTMGLSVGSVALGMLSLVNESTDYTYIAISLMIMGIGMGMFVSPNISSIMGSLPPQRRGIGSAFRATIFNVGLTSSLGLAILVMTFAIPYSTLSTVIALGSGGNNLDKVQFISGLDKAFLVMAAVNAVAILPSLSRGKRTYPAVARSEGDTGKVRSSE